MALTPLVGSRDLKNSPSISFGFVKNNADPMEIGRLQVFIPGLDDDTADTDSLPWCTYASPFGGVTANPIRGRDETPVPGIHAYGMWAIPKVGAQVLICFLGSPSVRVWFGCLWMPEHNRTLPSGINGLMSEIDQTGSYPQTENPIKKAHFDEAGLGESSEFFRTRGPWEWSAAYPLNGTKVKPDGNGYRKNPHDSSTKDSQTHCFTTPGGHTLIMSDVPEHCRIRLLTTAGSQFLLDDTNERIYISTARGKNWIELDEGTGDVYVYSQGGTHVHAEQDVNIVADGNINMQGQTINMKANEINISSSSYNISSSVFTGSLGSTNINVSDIALTSSTDIDLSGINVNIGGDLSLGSVISTSGGAVQISAPLITDSLSVSSSINGPAYTESAGPSPSRPNPPRTASKVNISDASTVEPGHEPWPRPNTTSRNRYWKP